MPCWVSHRMMRRRCSSCFSAGHSGLYFSIDWRTTCVDFPVWFCIYSGLQKSKTFLFSARANYLQIKLKLHVFRESKPFHIHTVWKLLCCGIIWQSFKQLSKKLSIKIFKFLSGLNPPSKHVYVYPKFVCKLLLICLPLHQVLYIISISISWRFQTKKIFLNMQIYPHPPPIGCWVVFEVKVVPLPLRSLQILFSTNFFRNGC